MNTLRIFAILVFVSLSASVVCSTADAQGNDALARRLVDQGVSALKGEQWATAQDRFQRAYELSPNALTLYNLGVAQMNGGKLVAADESFRQFLRDVGPTEYPAFRQEAERSRTTIKDRVAHLTVKISKFRPSLEVTLNEKKFAEAALGERLTVDPGQHIVVVSEGGVQVAEKSTTLAEGATGLLSINVPAPSPEQVARLAQNTEDKTTTSPLAPAPQKKNNTGLVIGIIVGVLLVAGAITAVALVSSKDSADPFAGSLPGFTLN